MEANQQIGRHMIKRPLIAAAVAISSVSIVGTATQVRADELQPITEAMTVVKEVNEVQNVVDGVPLADVGDEFVAITAESRVALPETATQEVTITPVEGETFSVGLPGDAEGVAAGDGVVYDDSAVDTSMVVKATENGGAQILVVLESDEAPADVAFPVSAPENSTLEANEDGTVSIVSREALGEGKSTASATIGTIAAPWAFDANGEAVPTSFGIDGMTLTQSVAVDASTAFPVTFDPTFSTGWTGIFAQWSRSEALFIKGLSLTALGGAAAPLCAGPHVVICGAALASFWYVLQELGTIYINGQYDRNCYLESRLFPFQSSYFKC